MRHDPIVPQTGDAMREAEALREKMGARGVILAVVLPTSSGGTRRLYALAGTVTEADMRFAVSPGDAGIVNLAEDSAERGA